MNDIIVENDINEDEIPSINLVSNFSRLRQQFLCCYPINLINLQDILKDLSWDEQKLLLQCTVLSEINQMYPIKRNYQINFMKFLIQTLERHCSDEVHDMIYETFCDLQTKFNDNLDLEKFSFKHYIVKKSENDKIIAIILKESSNFVMDGTTGLCSWQASIALADFLLLNDKKLKENFKNKSILELGSGTGLCSFMLSKYYDNDISEICLSDGSTKVIELLNENFKLNFKDSKVIKDTENYKIFSLNSTKTQKIGMWHLPWEDIQEYNDDDLKDIIQPDIIIASDVIYDQDILHTLSKTIDYLFRYKNDSCVMYLAATVRNEQTLDKFLKLLDDLNFSYQRKEHNITTDSKLFWDTRTPIEIFYITREK